MVIFQYNLYIFGIHLSTVLYPNSCYNEQCYKEVEVYVVIVIKPLKAADIFGLIVYNWAVKYKCQKFLYIVVQEIITVQCNQTVH